MLLTPKFVREGFFVFFARRVWSRFWALNLYFETLALLVFKIVKVFFSVGVLRLVLIVLTVLIAKFVKSSKIKVIVLLLWFGLAKSRKVPQASQEFLFFLLVRRRIFNLSIFSFFGIFCIFPRILGLSWSLEGSGRRSWVNVILLAEVRLHLIRAFLSLARALVHGLLIGSIVAKPYLLHHVEEQWLRILVFPSVHPAFPHHFLSLFWKICVQTHLRDKNGEGVLHLVES